MMAKYRCVQMSFWTDTKVMEKLNFEEKYLFLYLLTNPHTNLAGCYEIGGKVIAFETGFQQCKVEKLMESLISKRFICYCDETNEVLLTNWCKHNWTKSETHRKAVFTSISEVRCDVFREYLMGVYNNDIDTLSIPYQEGIGTTFRFYISNNTNTPNSNSISNNNESVLTEIKDIVAYLNEMTGQHYRASSKETQKHIKARLNEGFTVDDFKTVIYKKVKEWKNDPEMVKFLRPQTLFGTKFEAYLNQVEVKSKSFYDDMAEWAAKGDGE